MKYSTAQQELFSSEDWRVTGLVELSELTLTLSISVIQETFT